MGQVATVAAVEPDVLRACRRALGLTQAELADRLGVSANTVARWERGEQRVRHPQTIARILQRLENRRLAVSSHAPLDARLKRSGNQSRRSSGQALAAAGSQTAPLHARCGTTCRRS
jgi:transcriptional regulator with XRE-family HTH domain